jgi:signal transduction histidine kinase
MKKAAAFLFFLLSCCVVCRGQINEIWKLQKELPLIKDSLRYVDALNRLGMLLYEDNVDSTFLYTERARTIADRLQYDKGKADADDNLGVVYDMKGNMQLAFRYYNQAYNRYLTIHDTANAAQAMMNIALGYDEIDKGEKAVNSFKKAVAQGKNLKQDSIMSMVWYNYLLDHPEQFAKDSIQFYIAKAQQIAMKYKDKRVLLAIEQLTADIYIKNGQRNKGVALLRQAIVNAIKNNLYYLSLDIIVDLGDNFAPSDSAGAVSCYKQALGIAELKQYNIYTERLSKKLYDFYVAKKDIPKAFFYSQKLVDLHDRQEKVDNSSGVDYIEYALKDQQLESAQVQSRDELRFLFLALAICLFAIILLLILWRNWKQLHKTTGALRLQFEQSESTTEALEAMNNNYSRLIKIVAHDLRNPISAINTISGMLQPDAALPADMKELVNLIQVSSKNSLDLINELLETDFDQQQTLKREEFQLDELLAQCVSLLIFKAKDKNQQLLLNCNVPVKIRGDHEKLWRVVNNLIINAIKFSPEASSIKIECRKSENIALIMISDSGMGIPHEIQSKIFDPFTSARRTGTQGEKPFGLGLYISKQIVEAHQGKIWLESEAGKGTTFFVELPVEEGESEKSAASDQLSLELKVVGL